jgi:hypothetical protein
MNEDEEYDAPRIKKEVHRLLDSGVKLFYEWNAGGDETPCWAVIEPNVAFDKDVSYDLSDSIVSELHLPNAGECYNNGKGEIFFTPENALAIRFNAVEKYHDYEGEKKRNLPETYEVEIELEDVGDLKKFLVRETISLELYVDWKKEISLDLDFKIDEGDFPVLKPEEKAYYISKLLPYTEPYTKYFQINEEGSLGGTVHLSCRLSQTKKAYITIEADFEYITEFVNREVILLP